MLKPSMTDAYIQLVDAGKVQPDPVQVRAVHILDELGYRIAEISKNSGILGSLFGRPYKQGARGLYMWGEIGRGKSMLMDMFYDQIDFENKRRIHFLKFMQKLHSALHRVRQMDVKDAIPPVADELSKGCRLLCVDELQISDIADGVIVGRLFEHLFKQGVTIFSTANRPPEDLCKDGLNRHLFMPYVAILKNNMDVYEFGGNMDYRLKRMQGEKTYFCPLSKHVSNVIQKIWDDLSGGHSETLVLEFNKREIVFPHFSNGNLRAQFWDLCGQPLGPKDFLAIADTIKLLVLERVPQLSRSNYNEAKRFVMLIDALYEAKVKLIISAVSKPEDLYIEGGGSFEFERAASRLREMQSVGWGSNTD